MGKYGALQVWLWLLFEAKVLWLLFEAKVVLNDCTYDFFFWESWQRCVVLFPSLMVITS
jgi:hypothetical protein